MMIRNIRKAIVNILAENHSLRTKAAADLADWNERDIHPVLKALSDENTGLTPHEKHENPDVREKVREVLETL